MVDREQVRKRMEEEGIEFLLAQFVDVHGSARVKMVSVSSFDAMIDEGAGFVNLADNVEALVAVSSGAESITKTFPLACAAGCKLKPQITRNSGTSGITTSYATIYAVQ